MSYQHAIVWIDSRHARVIDFSVDDRHVTAVDREGAPKRVHQKSGITGSGKAPEDHHFHDEIVASLSDAREILIVGPAHAKVTFRKDLEKRHPKVAARVVGTESLDHPSDGELLAFAKQYFKRIDALRGDET